MSSLLASALNARTLPGCGLRFIRSDCPLGLTDAETAWLKENNITTVIDLREEKEYTAHPCRLDGEPGFAYHHLPVTGGGDTPESPEAVGRVYLGMLDKRMDEIIETILNAETNVLYFCGAGKDRTGVVSAVLLRRLGVDDDTIAADYMLTRDNLAPFLTAYANEHPEVRLETIMPNEANIRSVLAALKEN